MQQYFTDLVEGLEAKIRADTGAPSPRRLYALEVARLGLRLYDHSRPVAWCGVVVPFDLLNALGVSSCFVEFVGGTLASAGAVAPLLQKAEEAGFAPDMCGYHRAVTGAALAGFVPEPDFLVASTCPCSAGLATIENLARHFGKDLYLLHIPQEETPANVAYLADQLRGLVDFVTAHTGNRLDRAQLAEAMDATNRMRALMAETYALARTVPSPAGANDLRNFGIIMPLFFGTAHGVALAQAYRDEFAKRVANGVAGMPEEHLRLLWIQNRIQFKNPLEALLGKTYGAAIVIDELNTINWDPMDPADPFPGLARRIIRIPLNGTAQRRTAHLQQLAKDYRIDGAINPCHWGCRQGTGMRGLVAESFKEIGIPVLNLEVDCVDPRPFSEGQLRTRVEAFVEVLSSRPSPWG